MTTWLLTIGNTDVLLNSDKNWHLLERQARAKRRDLVPTSKMKVTLPNNEELCTFPARALGLVYADQLEKYDLDLRFPRLDALCQEFEKRDKPDQVIVLLTDQSDLFNEARNRRLGSPYWQDTCALQPILEFYLSRKLPDAKQSYHAVKPKPGNAGLDHWDSTLSLIQNLMAEIKCENSKTVYVSHQAGTPALSSAVQFVSLAKFGARVQFLVSNEFEENSSEVIASSTYLRGIRLQETKRLLARYDYAGIKELLKADLKTSSNPLAQKIQQLLDSAILWNCAQFQDFADSIGAEGELRSQEWWWMGYEAAYLAVIRLEQGNTVEAMFHSFRAVEGLLRHWIETNYSIKKSHWGPIISSKSGQLIQKNNGKAFKAYGKDLYLFLDRCRTIDKTIDEHIWIFGNHVFDRRNNLFHQIDGLQDKASVFQEWQSSNEKRWEEQDRYKWEYRILSCLNFISKQAFVSMQDASLMPTVHRKLKEAIAQLELQP